MGDRVFAARQQEFLSRAIELDNIQQRQHGEKRCVADEFNHAMVVQKKEEERQKLLQDAAEEIEELRCNLDSGLLSEVHAPSALGPHRKRSDHYKGMSGDEVVGIYMEQERQRRDKESSLHHHCTITARSRTITVPSLHHHCTMTVAGA